MRKFLSTFLHDIYNSRSYLKVFISLEVTPLIFFSKAIFFFFNQHWFCFIYIYIFFILHANPSSSYLHFIPPSYISSYPILLHSSQGVRPPLRSKQNLAYQVEAGPSHSPPAQRMSKESHHRGPKSQFMNPGQVLVPFPGIPQTDQTI